MQCNVAYYFLLNDLIDLSRFLTDDMKSLGIKCENCPIIQGIARAPASVVICSEETGSRTIVHSRGDLPELSFEDFDNKINLETTSWMHFEVFQLICSILFYTHMYLVHIFQNI
jgi:sugar/nucleoside kinase (ribokinase family)